jgi:MOSC domain-containing protein YiiM
VTTEAAGTLTAIAVVDRIKPKTWQEPLATAIDKQAIEGMIPIGTLGVAGDVQCDRKYHGGVYAAVYVYADEDAAWWAHELGREIPPGRFGENLRTSGIDVTGAEIGERWQIGAPGAGVLVEVCSPREPCRTFAEHMQQSRWVKRFTQRNAPGAYLRVLETGSVQAGDPVAVVSRPGHGTTIGDFLLGAQPGPMQRLVDAAAELDLDLAPTVARTASRAIKRG